MSKHINVNPGQYKVAGREHQGDGILHKQNKQALKNTQGHVLPGSRNAAAKSRNLDEPGEVKKKS